jgi:small conductance mechanosensitive channel
MNSMFNTFNLSFKNFVTYIPAIVGGIACIVATLFLANFLSKLISRYSLKRTKDPLISNFVGKIIWSVIFILGAVFALGILGLGNISNKILAGAGLTTFIIGFALKDIGENFLSGLILAFSRPYRVGNLIECEEVKGIVKDMTMRQTTVEAENGKIILIPNSMILKNPLIKYTNDDNNLRQEFLLSVDIGQMHEAIALLKESVTKFDFVMKTDRKPVKVVIDSLNADKVKLRVIYWFDVAFKGSRSGSRTEVMMAAFEQLKQHGIKFSG